MQFHRYINHKERTLFKHTGMLRMENVLMGGASERINTFKAHTHAQDVKGSDGWDLRILLCHRLIIFSNSCDPPREKGRTLQIF